MESISHSLCWSILVESSSACSTEQIYDHFKCSWRQYLNLEIFQDDEADAASSHIQSLLQSTVDSRLDTFLSPLCAALTIKPPCARRVLASYINNHKHDFDFSYDSLRATISSTDDTEQSRRLLRDLYLYYCSERLYQLMCTRALIAIDDRRIKQKFIEPITFVRAKFASQIAHLLNTVIGQFCRSVTTLNAIDPDSGSLNHSHLSSRQQQPFCDTATLTVLYTGFLLREQIELLHTLFALVCPHGAADVRTSTSNVHPLNHLPLAIEDAQLGQLFGAFTQHSFGTRCVWLRSAHSELVAAVCLLETSLFIHIVRRGCLSAANQHAISRPMFAEIHALLVGLGASLYHGPSLLMWLRILYTESDSFIDDVQKSKKQICQLTQQLAKFDLVLFVTEVFNNCNHVLDSSIMNVCRRIFCEDLIDELVRQFEITSFCSSIRRFIELLEFVLVPDAFEDILSRIQSCSNTDSEGLVGFLSLYMYRLFPLSSSILLNLCAALVRRSSCSNDKATSLIDSLGNMTHYSVLLNELPDGFTMALQTGTALDAEYSFCLQSDFTIDTTSGAVLKAGTVSHSICSLEAGSKWAVCWKLHNTAYSGWRFLLDDLDENISLIVDLMGQASCDQLIQIFQPIVVHLWRQNKQSLSHSGLSRHINRNTISLVGALAYYAPFDPQFVWKRMLGTLSESGCSFLTFESDFFHAVYLMESCQRSYPFTIQLLELCVATVTSDKFHTIRSQLKHSQVEYCFKSSSDNMPFLYRVVVYLIDQVFPLHTSWNYCNAFEKLRITSLCIRLLHSLLIPPPDLSQKRSNNQILLGNQTSGDSEVWPDAADQSKVDSFTMNIVRTLLEGAAGHKLIDVVLGFGRYDMNTFDTTNFERLHQAKSSPCNDHISTMDLIRITLSLVNRVFMWCEWCHNIGDCANDASASTNASICVQFECFLMKNHSLVVLAIVQCLTYANVDSKLAVLAVRLLGCFVTAFSATRYDNNNTSTFSLLTSLDVHECSQSVCLWLIRHLSLSSVLDDRLKVAILNLITLCVQLQPGIVHMMLGLQQQAVKESSPLFKIYCRDNAGELSLSFVHNTLCICSQYLDREKKFMENLSDVSLMTSSASNCSIDSNLLLASMNLIQSVFTTRSELLVQMFVHAQNFSMPFWPLIFEIVSCEKRKLMRIGSDIGDSQAISHIDCSLSLLANVFTITGVRLFDCTTRPVHCSILEHLSDDVMVDWSSFVCRHVVRMQRTDKHGESLFHAWRTLCTAVVANGDRRLSHLITPAFVRQLLRDVIGALNALFQALHSTSDQEDVDPSFVSLRIGHDLAELLNVILFQIKTRKLDICSTCDVSNSSCHSSTALGRVDDPCVCLQIIHLLHSFVPSSAAAMDTVSGNLLVSVLTSVLHVLLAPRLVCDQSTCKHCHEGANFPTKQLTIGLCELLGLTLKRCRTQPDHARTLANHPSRVFVLVAALSVRVIVNLAVRDCDSPSTGEPCTLLCATTTGPVTEPTSQLYVHVFSTLVTHCSELLARATHAHICEHILQSAVTLLLGRRTCVYELILSVHNLTARLAVPLHNLLRDTLLGPSSTSRDQNTAYTGWYRCWRHCVQIYTLLLTLSLPVHGNRHSMAVCAIDFVTLYSPLMARTLARTGLSHHLSRDEITDVSTVVHYIRALVVYEKLWRRCDCVSFDALILGSVPRCLLFLFRHVSRVSQSSVAQEADRLTGALSARSGCTDARDTVSNALLDTVCTCLSILTQLTPQLADILLWDHLVTAHTSQSTFLATWLTLIEPSLSHYTPPIAECGAASAGAANPLTYANLLSGVASCMLRAPAPSTTPGVAEGVAGSTCVPISDMLLRTPVKSPSSSALLTAQHPADTHLLRCCIQQVCALALSQFCVHLLGAPPANQPPTTGPGSTASQRLAVLSGDTQRVRTPDTQQTLLRDFCVEMTSLLACYQRLLRRGSVAHSPLKRRLDMDQESGASSSQSAYPALCDKQFVACIESVVNQLLK